MMLGFKDLILFAVAVLSGLGVLVGGIGYLYHVIVKNTRDEKSAVMNSAETLAKFWENQAEGYKTAIAEKDKLNAQKFEQLNKEMGELRGQLNAESALKKEYLAILQNRDPQMQEFIKAMMQSATDQSKINTEIVRVLGEIHGKVFNKNEQPA